MGLRIPLFSDPVAAGFPSPARDYQEAYLDLNDLCIKRPAATYFVRASGDSMINAGIHSGDILIVDRSIEARHRSIVVASLNGEFTVKRLIKRGTLELAAENPDYPALQIKSGDDFELFGVVTYVIHAVN